MDASPPRVYLACSSDVVIPCYSDERGGEALEWLGGINVAGSSASAPMRPLTIEEITKSNDIRSFFKDFYHVELTDAQLEMLVGS
jgi:hypothetical protein